MKETRNQARNPEFLTLIGKQLIFCLLFFPAFTSNCKKIRHIGRTFTAKKVEEVEPFYPFSIRDDRIPGEKERNFNLNHKYLLKVIGALIRLELSVLVRYNKTFMWPSNFEVNI